MRVKPIQPARLDEVFGCLKQGGNAKSVREMEEAIEREVRARHARGRF